MKRLALIGLLLIPLAGCRRAAEAPASRVSVPVKDPIRAVQQYLHRTSRLLARELPPQLACPEALIA